MTKAAETVLAEALRLDGNRTPEATSWLLERPKLIIESAQQQVDSTP